MRNTCSESGCDKFCVGGGLCRKHYGRKYRHGDTRLRRNPNGVPWLVCDGYVRVTVCGRLMLHHRYVMEQHVGRRLRSDEVVHHINGIKSDNRIENLVITNHSAHLREHNKGNKHLLGFKFSSESKKKISVAAKQRWVSAGYREAAVAAMSSAAKKRRRGADGCFI